MTEQPQNWETEILTRLYDAILTRMCVTYMLNELVKTRVQTPMKTGVIEHLRKQQQQQNYLIQQITREIDRQ